MAARPLPNFLVIGAARSGTTTLAAQLATHPQVFVAPAKEVHFFDRRDRFRRGVEWYRAQFAGARDEIVVGEATPTYMTRPQWIDRMAATVPDARLVAILRHPVERAYSQYLFQRFTFGRRMPPFAERVRDYLDGRADEPVYLRNSRYLAQLRSVCEHYPRESLSVVLLDDLAGDPTAVYGRLCEFLGIDDWRPPDLGSVRHARFRYRSRALFALMKTTGAWRRAPRLGQRLEQLNRAPLDAPPLDPGLRAALVAHFESHNAELGRWLGRDLEAWNA